MTRPNRKDHKHESTNQKVGVMTKKKETVAGKIEEIVENEAKELRREYKHFEKFRDENSLLLGVFVAAIVAILVINTLFWVQLSNHRLEADSRISTTIASQKASTSLQTVRNLAVQARVSNVGENTALDRAFPLAEGQTMLIMDITITNMTTRTQHLLPANQFYVRSDEGDYSPMHASSHITKPLEAKDLEPGESASGQISFGVNKHLTSPLLYIDTQWDNSTPLVIDVLH